MKMKKLLKNAVVYAIAASMLVASPLTASAGLIDAYKVTDAWGNVLSDDGNPTGTISSTDTSTSVLEDDKDPEAAEKIVGIVLDKTFVSTEAPYKGQGLADEDLPRLTASVLFDGNVTTEQQERLISKISWRVTELKGANPSRAYGALSKYLYITNEVEGKMDTVVLHPTHGTGEGNLLVTASIAGTDLEACAEVFIKEYATDYTFDLYSTSGTNAAYYKHKEDLSKLIHRVPASANDDIAWGSSDTAVATVTTAGVVTFKSNPKDVVITAVGEKGAKRGLTFSVSPGNPATEIKIQEEGSSFDASKLSYKESSKLKAGTADLQFDEARSVTLTAKITKLKMGGAGKADDTDDTTKISTDRIIWTSSKSNIVAIDTVNPDPVKVPMSQIENYKNLSTVKLTPKAVGKSVITAKTSSGKTAKYTLTVKATLTGLKIVKIEDANVAYKDAKTIGETTASKLTQYTGQKYQLAVVRTPAENTSKIKWSFADDDSKKNASIGSGTGLLKINATLKDPSTKPLKETANEFETVKIAATSAVKADKDNLLKNNFKVKDAEITVKQSAVKDITVTDPATSKMISNEVKGTKPAGQSPKLSNKNAQFDLSIPKKRDYTTVATIDASVMKGNNLPDGADTLSYTSSKPKVATVAYENGAAVIKALSAGTTTITVSGVYNKTDNKGNHKSYAEINVKFKVKVIQQIDSLTMKNAKVVISTKTRSKSVTSKVTKNPKKATGDITWSVNPENNVTYTKGAAVSKKMTFKNYTAGEKYVVTARAAKTGAIATSTVSIVSQTDKFNVTGVNTTISSKKIKDLPNDAIGSSKQVKLTIVPKGVNEEFAPGQLKTSGETTYKAADVTYKVNKAGIVSVVNEGDGVYTIYRIGKGDAKITFTTGDGKSYALTVKK